MAKLNRVEIMEAYNKKCDVWGISDVPEYTDTDECIDAFGKLAKAGIKEEQLYALLDGDKAVSMFDFLDPKYVKAHTRKPAGKVVEKVVEKVEVKPMEIDASAVLGAMGKAMAESLAGEYAPLVAESALPIVEKFISDRYDTKSQKVTIEVPDRGGATGVFHEVFEKVLKYVIGGTPVMLVGEAGTGKNVMTEQVAEAMGLKFYFANKVSDEYQLKGFVDAKGEFQSTPLYTAMKEGGVFMLDEMDASNEEALEVLHSVLSNKYLTFPNGEFVRCHKDFRVVAGCNTFGTGATYQYVGRHQLDAATLNRFMTVVVDYSPTIEDSLTDDKDLLKFIRKFRKCCKEFGINHVVSYRNITQLDKYVDAVGVEDVLRDGLLKNLEKDDLTMLIGRFDADRDRWSQGLKNCLA